MQDTWDRIEACNAAAGWFGEWTEAERDQIEALADDLDRELELYPVIHAWRTNNGSPLTFWCKDCKDHHVHGRHTGSSHVRNADTGNPDSPVSTRMWLAYLNKFARCKYNDCVPGGRGVCTCPAGSGDGHRVAHCWSTDSAYWKHGYVLHEVEPNDARALQKPKRTRKS